MYKNNLTRSQKLRKYEKIYKNIMNKDTVIKSPRRSRIKNIIPQTPPQTPPQQIKIKPRKLTEYNKFVREESKKEMYKTLSSHQRLKEISTKWKNKK